MITLTQEFDATMQQRSAESLVGIPADEFMGYITPKIEQAITLDGLHHALTEKGVLSVKFGTDPTGPDLHLGHAVPLRLLDLFERAGHNIDVIFGDFTATIGDPSDRSVERPLLTEEQIAENMSTFKDQVAPFVHINGPNVRSHTNSSWLNELSPRDLFRYFHTVNMSTAWQRDDFRTRAKNGSAVSLAEVSYAVLMGIDSVHLGTDVEVGGVDQLLNFAQARDVMAKQGMRPEQAVMTPMIEGTDGSGAKMSKSAGNYIAVRAPANDQFGKIMSIPDSLLLPYASAFAPVHAEDMIWLDQFRAEQPLEFKKQLGTYVVSLGSGNDVARQVREQFERRYAKREISEEDMTVIDITGDVNLVSALSGTGRTNSEIRRLIKQQGISINGQKVSSHDAPVHDGDVIKVGKRDLYKLTQVSSTN